MNAAEKTKDYKGSQYYKHVGKDLKTAIYQHNDLTAGVPIEEKRRRLYQALLNHDQDVALAIFFLIIDLKTYKPDLTKDFSDWKTISTKLEFNHKGKFEKVVKTFWKYENDKSKYFTIDMYHRII